MELKKCKTKSIIFQVSKIQHNKLWSEHVNTTGCFVIHGNDMFNKQYHPILIKKMNCLKIESIIMI